MFIFYKMQSIEVRKVCGEIQGKITEINHRNQKVWIWTEQMKKTFICTYDFFCPLGVGDAINATFEVVDMATQLLKLIRPPLVKIGTDKMTILNCFCRIKGIGSIKANCLYEQFVLVSVNEGKSNQANNVISYIDHLVYLWKQSKNKDLMKTIPVMITDIQKIQLLNWWYKKRILRQLYLFGLTNGEIRKCRCSEKDIYTYCITNPYKLTPVTISKCNKIWEIIKKNPTKVQVDQAMIIRKIYDYFDNYKWVGTPIETLINYVPNLTEHIEELMKEYHIQWAENTIYLPYPYKVETKIVEVISNLIKKERIVFGSKITYTRPDLNNDQKNAINNVLQNSISIINGGAGTGKTTIIGEIVHNLEQQGRSYAVVSFTGKAVARIKEAVKIKSASTMHRLIAKSQMINKFGFLIIDETSMVTINLLYQFIKTFGYNYQIVFLGDINQLQPIEWGNLFDQLLKIDQIPKYNLKQNHRSDLIEDDGILLNSEKIIRYQGDSNIPIPFSFEQTVNFKLLSGGIDEVCLIVSLLHDNGIKATDITVLSPYNKTLSILNPRCQQIFNSGNNSINDSKGRRFMINDRVMVNTNNYKRNIMNGEEGIIIGISNISVKVKFNDESIHDFLLFPSTKNYNDDEDLDKNTVNIIDHSYAITIHKSQGSEWEYVILFVEEETNDHGFLDCKLINTAITRARKGLYCVGDMTTLNASATRPVEYRCDNLAQRVKLMIED